MTLYELLDRLEQLAEKWENKPYTGDYTKGAYSVAARELREIIGRPDYIRVHFVHKKGEPHPVAPDEWWKEGDS